MRKKSKHWQKKFSSDYPVGFLFFPKDCRNCKGGYACRKFPRNHGNDVLRIVGKSERKVIAENKCGGNGKGSERFVLTRKIPSTKNIP